MKIKILAGLMFLLVCCWVIHAEPTFAANNGKLIDYGGQFKYPDGYTLSKSVWKVYKVNKNTIKIFLNSSWDWDNNTQIQEHKYILQKISKNKIKVQWYYDGAVYVSYKKTKKSVFNYYWDVFRPKRMLIM